MMWNRMWPFAAAAPQDPDLTFHIRIKLDSQETLRRLEGRRRYLPFPREHLISLLRLIESDRGLERQLYLTEQQIRISASVLKAHPVDEREYLAEIVLQCEACLSRVGELLKQVNLVNNAHRSVPEGYYLRACFLAYELGVRRTTLRKLDKRLSTEKEHKNQKDLPDIGLARRMRQLAALLYVHDPLPPRQEHRQMRHLFRSHWKPGAECNCWNYL